MGNMRLQPEPFHTLQECGHRNKHRGVNPARGKEAPAFQDCGQITVLENSLPALRLASSSAGTVCDRSER